MATEPLRPGDLPDMEKSFWRMTGPGAIMVGLAVGSGELVLWPWITARFGAVMAWAPLLAVFLQAWITIEIGRWAIATGESATRGLARAWVGIIYLFLGIMLLLTMLPGWGRLTAATVRFLIFGADEPWPEGSVLGSDWLWYIPVTLAVWAVLLGPTKIYNGVEMVVTIMVIVIFLGLIVVVARIGTMQDAREMAAGMLRPRIVLDEDFEFLRFFGALVFAGAGGFGLMFYAYYLRDKGIGMGQRFPMLEVEIRGKSERANETGYVFADTPANQQRFRDWQNYVIYDTTLFFGVASMITLLLFMFAALVTLYPQEQGFGNDDLIWSLSNILGAAMGRWGQYLFLVVAIAALFSTIVANVDGGVRMWTDLIHTGFPRTTKWPSGLMYVTLMIGTWPIGFFSSWYFETHEVSILDFFFINAALNGGAMAIFTPTILYLNLRFLPKSARPGTVNIFFVLCATLMYAGFSVYLVGDKLVDLLEW